MELYLIRHGRTDWNDEGRYQGQADPPLNGQGWLEAYRTALRLSAVRFEAVYSSDLRRAKETAGVFTDLVGLPLALDPRLREICQGEWQGLSTSEIAVRFPKVYARWKNDPSDVRLPGGETLLELENRLRAALEEMATRHPAQRVAVFTHKIPIAVLRCRAHGLPLVRFWEMLPRNGEWEILRRASGRQSNYEGRNES